ncbi:MAG: hypothetical protein ACLUFV_05460 [Acutalibacteraceae bacterium]
MKRCNIKLHPRSEPPSSAAPVSREGAALPRRVSFYTLGCRVNAYETQAMEERFRAAGFAVVPSARPATSAWSIPAPSPPRASARARSFSAARADRPRM